jgi:hypothetical protein
MQTAHLQYCTHRAQAKESKGTGKLKFTEYQRMDLLARNPRTAYRVTMKVWRFLLAIGTSIFVADVAWAGAKIVTRLNTNSQDGETSSSITFSEASCEEECQIATLSCNNGGITITLADIDTANAAKAITRAKQQILLKADGKSFDYFIYDMTYMELTGSWWLTARLESGNAEDLVPSLSKTKAITAQINKKTIALPTDKNLKSWAAACK